MTGYFTYRYALEIELGRFGALIAGTIFGFTPFRTSRSAGHLPLIETQWFSLFLLFLERFAKKPARRNGLGMGLSFAALTLSSWYYGVMAVIISPIYVWVRTVPVEKDWRVWLKSIWPGILVTGGLILPFLAP